MKTRKIVLLAACAVLLCVCIAQGVLAGRNPVRTAELSETPDSILIECGGAETQLLLDGGSWYIGDSAFKVAAADMDAMLRNIREVKILDAVGRSGNEAADDRYELDGGTAIAVSAVKDGAEIRSLKIGKASSTGAQTYITLDGGKDVLLVSGNLRSIFGKSIDDLKSKVVYSLDAEQISAVSSARGAAAWGVARADGDDGAAWTFTGTAADVEIDAEKADAWVQSLANLSVSSWLADDTALPAEPEVSVTITSGEGDVVVSVYKADDGGDTKYICTCSRTPHLFELSGYPAGKFRKTADELAK
ncbi:MAG: DUF4340 domain-containing protein [Treponemataceae bacterium]|nr:DUF4340 domain-containing protein [Treponemataceae bacterium]